MELVSAVWNLEIFLKCFLVLGFNFLKHGRCFLLNFFPSFSQLFDFSLRSLDFRILFSKSGELPACVHYEENGPKSNGVQPLWHRCQNAS